MATRTDQIIGDDRLLCHPFVLGVLALRSLRNRDAVLAFLAAQREAVVATHAEVMTVVVAAALVPASRGLGFMILSAAQFLVTDIVLEGIAVIAIVAFALEWLARFVERPAVSRPITRTLTWWGRASKTVLANLDYCLVAEGGERGCSLVRPLCPLDIWSAQRP